MGERESKRVYVGRCYELKLQLLWQYSQDHSPSFSSSSSGSSYYPYHHHHRDDSLWFWFCFWGPPWSMTMIHLIMRITMTMIHLILASDSTLLAHHHGVLEINVGCEHVLGSKDLLPHPLHDHEPHLLPITPHRSSSVTSLLIHPIHPYLLFLCLLHELWWGGWDVAKAMEHCIHGLVAESL